MTIAKLLAWVRSRFEDDRQGQVEAPVLLGYVLNMSSAQLIANENKAVTRDDELTFCDLITQRLDGMPVAYLVECREFWSLPLYVNQDVLIPRHETETLVERVLCLLDDCSQSRILELGCGSGAIALALACEMPDAQLIASDISAVALDVAKRNQENLNIGNISWVQSDWFENLSEQRFHLICSNPPYIAPNEPHLHEGDLRFEPIQALQAQDSGYEALQLLISQSQNFLYPEGWLVVEHGYQQGQSVRERFYEAGFVDVKTVKDLSGNDRVTQGRKKSII